MDAYLVGPLTPRYCTIKNKAKIKPMPEGINPRNIATLSGNTEKFVASFDQTLIDLIKL